MGSRLPSMIIDYLSDKEIMLLFFKSTDTTNLLLSNDSGFLVRTRFSPVR